MSGDSPPDYLTVGPDGQVTTAQAIEHYRQRTIEERAPRLRCCDDPFPMQTEHPATRWRPEHANIPPRAVPASPFAGQSQDLAVFADIANKARQVLIDQLNARDQTIDRLTKERDQLLRIGGSAEYQAKRLEMSIQRGLLGETGLRSLIRVIEEALRQHERDAALGRAINVRHRQAGPL